jgi:hypothetical protein
MMSKPIATHRHQKLVGALATVTAILSACGGGGAEPSPPPVNLSPIANAGPNQTTSAGATVMLDGSNSRDPESSLLRYRWKISSKPESSLAPIMYPGDTRPNFTPDVPGTYTISLTVQDSASNSSPESLTTVTATGTQLAVGLWDVWNASTGVSNTAIVAGGEVRADTQPDGGNLRAKIVPPVDGDNFRINIRAKVQTLRDHVIGIALANEHASGTKDFSRQVAASFGEPGYASSSGVRSSLGYYFDWVGASSNIYEWHTYSIDIRGGRIRLSIDGVEVFNDLYEGTIGPLDSLLIGANAVIFVDTQSTLAITR